MSAIEDFVANDRFGAHLGLCLVSVGAGRARAEMKVAQHHMNSANTVHGGAIFALADFVFAAASNSHGTLAMAINVSISYLKAVREGTLTAVGEEVSLNPKLATYNIRVTDDGGDLVATFQGMVYRKRDPIDQIAGAEQK